MTTMESTLNISEQLFVLETMERIFATENEDDVAIMILVQAVALDCRASGNEALAAYFEWVNREFWTKTNDEAVFDEWVAKVHKHQSAGLPTEAPATFLAALDKWRSER